MLGKIALEEHWAIAETQTESAQALANASSQWADVLRRLPEIHENRLKEMDDNGIELAILSLNAPAIQAVLDRDEAITLAKRSNDILAEEVGKRPDRFLAFAALPMQEPGAAAEELARCVRDLGMVGALVNGFTQRDIADSAVYYDVPEFRPFWATCEELDVPFYLHPRTQIPSRMQAYAGHPWLVAPAWGFARETSIHALRLMGSGLFDAHPRLQIILGHLGERIPYDIWRIDHRNKKSPTEFPANQTIRHYMQNNVHITTSGHFSTPTLELAITEMGIDRVMFSVDYPFEECGEAAQWFDALEMDPADIAKMGRGNAAKLFKLDK